jgi:hypothetical protein
MKALAFALLAALAGNAAAQAPAAAPTPAGRLFHSLDTNRDHVVSAQEFEAGYADLQRAMALAIRLREQFRTVDADRSGAIEAREYAAMVLVKQAGAQAPSLATFDADRDARLGFPEYVAAVRELAARAPAKAGG